MQLALGGGGVERGELLVSFDPLADSRVERDNGTRLRRGERDSRAAAMVPVAGTDCVMSFAATVVTSAAVSTTPSGPKVR
ncbi:hypothetical protein AZH45_01745 [Corynebacterium striatum]|nr:hypothetical protein AZH45_01745 [Corynebacterium striatum]